MLDYEHKARQNGYQLIIGIDEVGRGPLAGPVVASAVALRKTQFLSRIDDSKKMTPVQREKAFLEIFNNAHVGIGVISESVIDDVNILQATFLAMRNAVDNLLSYLPAVIKDQKEFTATTFLLIDGNRFQSDLPYKYQTIVNGDGLSLSIACASIVAKVTRDRILNSYDQVFPEYGFKDHKGYPTFQHREALKKFGPSLIHRKTFHGAA